MMSKYFFKLGVAALIAAWCVAMSAAEALPEWRIVAPEGMPEYEKAAVADLAKYMEKMTGRAVAVGEAPAKHTIYFKRQAPSVKSAPGLTERRVKGENGDLYIWGGNDRYNAAFAVYDLLEKHFGCRFFTPWDEKVPRLADGLGDTDRIDLSHTPGFRRIACASTWKMEEKLPEVSAFIRKRRMLIPSEGRDGDSLGITSHSLGAYYPSGMVPEGKRAAESVFGPYKYFKTEKNFLTHPEHFSLDENGKRVWNRQVCFANPGLRKALAEHVETVVRQEYRHDGPSLISLTLNDNAYMCCCKGCRALEKKYGTRGGAYYDYIIELANRLKKSYPELRLLAMAYRPTEEPPNVKLPDNVVLRLAPLGKKDFLKPFESPSNEKVRKLLQKMALAADNVAKWYYVTPFPYGFVIPEWPLVAYRSRFARDFKFMRKCHVTDLFMEFGGGSTAPWNELNTYLASRLADDPDADADAVIGEFAEYCYGPAAPRMVKFIRELDGLAAKERFRLRWDPDPQMFSYLTPENLTRWNSEFDAMVSAVADNHLHLRHVLNARVPLDQAMMAAVGKFRAAGVQLPLTPEELRDRCVADLDAGLAALRHWNEKWYFERHRQGLDMEYAMARGAQLPLPPELKGVPARRIRRLPPVNGYRLPPADPKAAFGFAVEVAPSALKKLNIISVTGQGEYHFKRTAAVEPPPNAMEEYRLFKLGKFRLSEDMWLVAGKGRFLLGRLFDAAKPKAEYELYLSLRRLPDGALRVAEVVAVASAR